MLKGRLTRRRARGQQGFTLIEVLVATLVSTVVLGGLYMILEVSLHQSSRVSDFAQATQLGRIAMTRMLDELHSACLSQGFKPVQAESSESRLIVINAYSERSEIPAERARRDKLEWVKEANGGTLTDSTAVASGGTWPKFTFPKAYASSVRLSDKERVSQAENEGKKVPVFRYYEYATKAPSKPEPQPSSEAGTGVATLVPISLPEGTELTAVQAEKVASVQISFRTAPTSGSKEVGRSADQSNQVTFAFAVPSAEATIKDAPCE